MRVAATALLAALLLASNLWGQDDHFPFAPFRMYSVSSPPDAPTPDTRVEGVDVTGAVVPLDQANTGIRRAEIEGQQSRYVADPSLLQRVVDAYVRRHPDAPALVEVRIVTRWHGVRDSRPTGEFVDETVVSWRVPA